MDIMITQEDYNKFYEDIMEYIRKKVKPDTKYEHTALSLGLSEETNKTIDPRLIIKKYSKRRKSCKISYDEEKSICNSISLGILEYGEYIDEHYKSVFVRVISVNDKSELERLKREIAFDVREKFGIKVCQEYYDKFYDDIIEYFNGKTYVAPYKPTVIACALPGFFNEAEKESMKTTLFILMNKNKFSLSEREYGRYIDKKYKSEIIRAMRNYDEDNMEKLKHEIALDLKEHFGIGQSKEE